MENYTSQVSQHSEPKEMDSLIAERILKKAILDFRKGQIQKEIDQSLQDRNREAFLRLTEQLKNIS
ncbi:IDEAL domain-containing protein [Priestia abyssalis]|uniref:IDEAL domain-containing protein n=1 Tax=Priestia abyssalis TaxID=1221450 RepID=UPI00099589A7|nr:IDEAL domain-containing protein [Priestia abyssalis]